MYEFVHEARKSRPCDDDLTINTTSKHQTPLYLLSNIEEIRNFILYQVKSTFLQDKKYKNYVFYFDNQVIMVIRPTLSFPRGRESSLT